MHDDKTFFEDDPDYKSKTAVKNEMHELRDLGLELIALPQSQFNSFPLTDTIRAAMAEYKRITHKNALKRQASFIGKLMRSEDVDTIRTQFDEMKERQHRTTRQLPIVEQWRDRLLADDAQSAFDEFTAQFPDCDRQQMRSLMRNAAREREQNKPASSARKLFKLIQVVLAQE